MKRTPNLGLPLSPVGMVEFSSHFNEAMKKIDTSVGAKVPSPAAGDIGKFLTVGDDGNGNPVITYHKPLDPTALSQPLVLWLDASDEATITDEDGRVSEWQDKSGEGNHATAEDDARPTSGTRDVGGRNVLAFDGTANSLTLPEGLYDLPSGENSVFVVFRNDNVISPVSFLFDSASGSTRRMAISTLDTPNDVSFRYPSSQTRTFLPDDNPHCLGWVSGGTTVPFLDHDDFEAITVTRNSATVMSLGSRYDGGANYFKGVICEVMFFSGALTDSEKAEVLAYLDAKWSLGKFPPVEVETTFDFGVNLAGAEFQDSVIPGSIPTNYDYPSNDTIDAMIAAGASIIRLPFRWERLQRTLGGEFDEGELGILDAKARRITAAGVKCILDPHNYARYRIDGTLYLIGTAEVAEEDYLDFMTKLANHFKDDPLMVFCLMNEPNGLSASEWAGYAQNAAYAIRATGATNLIHVPGTSYTGAHSWLSPSGNAAALVNFDDPNFAFDVHQYLDSDSSGTGSGVVSEHIGRIRVTSITQWARSNGVRLFLGEFNGGDQDAGTDSTALAALRNMMGYILGNADVWMGATMWAGGNRWASDYYFKLTPESLRYTEMRELVDAHNSRIQ